MEQRAVIIKEAETAPFNATDCGLRTEYIMPTDQPNEESNSKPIKMGTTET